MSAWVVVFIWLAVVIAGAIVGGHVGLPSLGRRPLQLPRHRPDYQKIAQLERELGMSKDPRVIIDPDGTTRVVDRGEPKPSRVMPIAPDPEFQLPDPGRPLIADHPPMFRTYDDYMAYIRARTPKPDK